MAATTIMNKDELLKDFPPKSSVRYEGLESVLQKALQASRKHFDVETSMMEVYGADDVASFGKDTLRVFFDSGLNKIQKEVTSRMRDYCQEQEIPDELLKIEALAGKLEREATWDQYLEEQDHLSAQRALEEAKLSDGYTAEDVIQFQIHEQLEAQQAALEAELAQIEADVAKLEQRNQQMTEFHKQQEQKVAKLAAEMEKVADVASAISK